MNRLLLKLLELFFNSYYWQTGSPWGSANTVVEQLGILYWQCCLCFSYPSKRLSRVDGYKNIKDVNVSWSTFHSRLFNPRQCQLMTKSPSIHYWVFHRKRICFMGLKCFYRQHYCHSTLCIWNVSAPACNNNVLTNTHLLLNHSLKYCGCTSTGFMSMQLHCRSK